MITTQVSNIFISSAVFALLALLLKLYALSSQIDELKGQNEQLRGENIALHERLTQQNAKIEALKFEAKKRSENKAIVRVEKIRVKDDTCEEELNAYKALFNVSKP